MKLTEAIDGGEVGAEEVIVSSTQPTDEGNKIWIKESDETEVTVPTSAEFAELENEVSEVKSTIRYEKLIKVVSGKYIALNNASVTMENGKPVYTGDTQAGYGVGIESCVQGDKFVVSGTGGGSTRLWGFINSSGEILSVSDAAITESNLELIAPEDAAFIIIHDNSGQKSYKYTYTIALNDVVRENSETITEDNSVDIIKNLSKTSQKVNGVDYYWAGDSCRVKGTASAQSHNYLWKYTDGLPDGIEPGGKYCLYIEKTGTVANVRLIWLLTNSTKIYREYDESALITVPTSVTGVSIAIHVNQGATANEIVSAKIIKMAPDTRYAFEKLEELHYYIQHDCLPDFANYANGTSKSVTFTWDDDLNCTVNGTATGGIAFNRLYSYENPLPTSIIPGNEYALKFVTSEEDTVRCKIYIKRSDDSVTNTVYYSSTNIFVPLDTVAVGLRLEVNEGVTADNVLVSIKLETVAVAGNNSANHVAKLLSIGSSFMTGAIYPGGVFDHICSYDNSPWGNVAIGLNIEEKNATHLLASSTGLLYDAGKGSILSIVKGLDLSEYDYLLTQYNRPDLGTYSSNGFPLGDLTSVAGDGSIVGAVLDMLAYMKTSNPNCTLILVGAPPSDLREGFCYEDVFTAIYNNGVSIGEADLMLHRLAVREHFIFIDWEDLNLSYYYKDLTCGTNVHPEHDATCRAMGLYLARNCDYSHSLARVLKADIQSS